MLTDTDETTDTIETGEAARLEELRFAKRQQWAITIAAITLMAAAYHVADTMTVKAPLASWEKHFAAFFVLAVAAGGSYLILKLQHHLRVTRKRIKKEDPNPWLRGFDVAIGLVIALIISAAAVCYSFWR